MRKIIIYLFLLLLIFNISNNYSYALNIDNSPYILKPKKERLISSIGMSLLVLSLVADIHKKSLSESDINNISKDQINSFDRSAANNWSEYHANMSDYLVAVKVSIPLSLLLFSSPRKDCLKLGIIYMESLLISLGTCNLVKSLVNRKRPFVYNPDIDIEIKKEKDSIKSFYSGHTTMSFNSAVFFSTVYADYYPESPWKPAIWASSLTFASVIGYLRYRAGKHFPTDILTGAVMGSLSGYLLPAIHRKKENNYSIIPYFKEKTGLALIIKY